MMQIRIIILSVCFCLIQAIHGQCIDRDTLWHEVEDLWKSSASLSVDAQLNELLRYEDLLRNCTDTKDSSFAFLLFRIGAVYYRKNEFSLALQFAHRSIDLIHQFQFLPAMNIRHLVPSYYYLSIMYGATGNTREKMTALDSCIDIADRYHIIDLYSLSALYTRIEYFFDVADYAKCMRYAAKGEKDANEYAGMNLEGARRDGLQYASDCIAYEVAALIKLKSYDPAEAILKSGIEYFRKLSYWNILGTYYHQLAKIALYKGDDSLARFRYGQALYYDKKYGSAIGCKMILIDMGYSLSFEKNHDLLQALQYLRKALQYKNTNAELASLDAVETLNGYANMANFHAELGNFDSAFYYFSVAFGEIEPRADEKTFITSPLNDFIKTKKLNYLINLVIDKGIALRKWAIHSGSKTYLNKAIDVFESADKLLDRIKQEQSEMQSKLLWRTYTRRLYEEAIETCFLSNRVEDAFYFLEKSRSAILAEQIDEQAWLVQDEIISLKKIKLDILSKERQLASGLAGPAMDSVKEELFRCKRNLDKAYDRIRQDNPTYYQNYLDKKQAKLTEIGRYLADQDCSFIELFYGTRQVYVLLITGGATVLKKIDRTTYQRLLLQYNFLLADHNYLNSHFGEFERISRELFKLLFGGDTMKEGRMIFSPDGPYLPLDALNSSKIDGQPRFFIYDHAVSYTYSASYLLRTQSTELAADKIEFLGLAPVSFARGQHLAELKGSDASLKRIADHFSNAEIYIGPKASRQNFMEHYSRFSVVQLYTHADDSSLYAEPVIYFNDSALYLSDLVNEFKPRVKLVVISACKTGKGRLFEGEGVFNFGRGFAAVGIPTSITNLWSADNQATYAITENFYSLLRKGESLDVALQQAKIQYMKNTDKRGRLPYYWAGLVLEGRPTSLIRKETHQNQHLIINVLLLWSIAGSAYLIIRFARKKYYKSSNEEVS